MNHEMNLKEVYFDKIKSGEKTYEIRLNDEKRKLIKIGDIIVFKRQPEFKESIKTVVKDLFYFNSFTEMINSLPIEKVGFKGKTLKEIVDIYHQIYSEENEKKYGVLAIKIEVVH